MALHNPEVCRKLVRPLPSPVLLGAIGLASRGAYGAKAPGQV